jgi:serine/threonine-protein kinase
MGEVFEGFDETLHRRVALKTIRTDRRLDEGARNRFLREARMLSQLDHPGICRIYDYVEGDDRDLLVLELIEGRTLRAALRGRMDFHQKLRIAEDVARALAAAHRLGIVHRDLKPDNIMLTTDGVVKVLDFGLARAIVPSGGDGSAEIPPVANGAVPEPAEHHEDGATLVKRPATPSSPMLAGSDTRIGETVGTPAYMSPEQARGETITTASDMYSFGLVLQYVFSDRDPHHDFLTPPLLIELASRGESLPAAGIDRDVTALINSLKLLAPSERPTAVDVVNRLRWIATRSRRIVRRLATAALLLIAVLATAKYIVDVRHERNVAILARADADRRRGQAEELIGFMVGDLRTKLEGVGQLDVLDDVGAQALRYFKSLRPEEINPAELRRNAKTLSQLGEVRMAQGNLNGAEEVLKSSILLARAAADRDPADGANQIELGVSHFWMGTLRRQQGDLAGALSHYTTYLRLSEKLAASDPTNRDYRVEVGYGHSNVGTILEQQGDLEGALEHYQRAVALKEREVPAEAQRASWNGEMAVTVNKIGVVLLSLGRYPEAQQALDREQELLESVLQLEPKNSKWLYRLGVNQNFKAVLFEDRGELDTSLGLYRQEQAMETRLVALDSANAVWQRSLAATDLAIGRILHHRGDVAASELSYRQALARLDPLLKKDPGRLPWRRDFAAIHEGLALIMLERGDVAAARRESEIAREVLAGVALTDKATRRAVWRMALTRGEIAARSGDSSTAQAEWKSVADTLWASRESLRDVAELDLLARALLHLNRVDDAAPIVQRLAARGYAKHALMKLWNAKRPRESATRA